MAAANPYTISRPAEVRHDELFTENRRVNGLDVNTGRISGSHVVNVTDDDDQLDDALRAAGADLLGGQYSYARAGFVRHALRATSQGAGRGRWR